MCWRRQGFNRGLLNKSCLVQGHISGCSYKACPLGWGVVGVVDSCLLIESSISLSSQFPALPVSHTHPLTHSLPRKCHLLIWPKVLLTALTYQQPASLCSDAKMHVVLKKLLMTRRIRKVNFFMMKDTGTYPYQFIY